MNDTVFRLRFLLSSFLLVGATLGFSSGSAFAGGDWVEVGDAPDGVPARQVTQGVQSSLVRIVGSLNRPAGDHVDTYSIVVTDPNAFYATLDPFVDTMALAGFDSRLYLWTKTGEPLLGNEGSTLGSDATIADPALFNFLTGGNVSPEAGSVSLVAGETYLLSITTAGNDPQDAAFNGVVDLPGGPGELAGASSTAGDFEQWENLPDSTIGIYQIALQGATFSGTIVPEPSTSCALFLLLASLACRRENRWHTRLNARRSGANIHATV